MLREQLTADLKQASETDDRRAVATIRLIQAALLERDLKARTEGESDGMSDADVQQMLRAMVDQRCSCIRRYEESGQLDLAAREAEEIEVIKRFLPQKLDDEQCADAVQKVIDDLGAEKLKETGRVIGELKQRYPDRMDFAKARRMVCRKLG
ncbi:MAG: GatB/YqeY domain-containing protein [Geminicoccaceae bacterium]|nr:GatB/YqeY domain-containing protein [Geminicoccaceae bacterium]